MKIRQSMLTTGDNCLRQMQYTIESPVYHGGSTRAVGTAYHAGLELFYGKLMSEGEYPALIAEVIPHALQVFDNTAAMAPSHESELERIPGNFQWDEKFPDTETAHQAIAVMLTAYFEGGHAWPVVPYPKLTEFDPSDGLTLPPDGKFFVLDVEASFLIPFGNHHSTGSIDLTLLDSTGGVVCVDHKTTGKKWNYNKHTARKQNQSPWYVRGAQHLWPDAPSYRFCFDIMTYKGEFERRISDVTEAHIEAVEVKAIQLATLYDGMRAGGMDLPTNSGSNLCSPKYCDYWSECPHGSVLD